MTFVDKIKSGVFKLLASIPVNYLPSIAKILGTIWYSLERIGPYKGYLENGVAKTLQLDTSRCKEIVRASFINMVYCILEMARFKSLKEEWSKNVEVVGIEYLNEVLKDGKGAILLSAHLGNFELIVCGLPLAEIPLHTIAWIQDDTFENRYLDELRQLYGNKLVYSQEITTEIALNILRDNQALLIVADHYNLGRNIVSFFGIPAHIPAGPVHYSLQSEAAILPIYTIKENGRNKIIIEPPLEIEEFNTLEETYQNGLQKCVSKYEAWIRLYPEQYMWYLKRFEWGNPSESTNI